MGDRNKGTIHARTRRERRRSLGARGWRPWPGITCRFTPWSTNISSPSRIPRDIRARDRASPCHRPRRRELPCARRGRGSASALRTGKARLLGPWRRQPSLGVPARALPDKFDKIEESIAFAYRRFPVLETAGIKSVIHGPFTFAPRQPAGGAGPGAAELWSPAAAWRASPKAAAWVWCRPWRSTEKPSGVTASTLPATAAGSRRANTRQVLENTGPGFP